MGASALVSLLPLGASTHFQIAAPVLVRTAPQHDDDDDVFDDVFERPRFLTVWVLTSYHAIHLPLLSCCSPHPSFPSLAVCILHDSSIKATCFLAAAPLV